MEFLSIESLNLSATASEFVKSYISTLNKPLHIAKLPDDYPNFACMSPHPNFYMIGIRSNIEKADFDTNFCHELYHAYQMSIGFPMVKGYQQDTCKFCEHLRSTILDLSDNEALKSFGLRYDSVVRTRYKQCKHLCATSFKEISNPFNEALLAIDLILDLRDFTNIQNGNILQSLQKNLPCAYDRYNTYHQIIFEQYDYHTKEGCLGIFARFFDEFRLWRDCSILYNGKDIRTRRMLKH